MIFDSEAAITLCSKFASLPDFEVPLSVVFSRSDRFSCEREYIEGLAAMAPPNAQKDWIARLISQDDEQHLGAWFEIMLSGWLRDWGPVIIQPEIDGDHPDFLVKKCRKQIVVEARTIVPNESERQRQRWHAEVTWVLGHIGRPFIVTIEQLIAGGRLDRCRFASEVTQWLDRKVDQPLVYQDESGNTIALKASPDRDRRLVLVIGPTEAGWVSAQPLKPALKAKSRQHRAIRTAGYPYVIAVLLESPDFDAEEVVTAWLGSPQLVIDRDSGQVVEQTIDGTGIHFFGSEIRHTTVTGTLVFRRMFDEGLHRHRLDSWYIQNPFAKVTIDPDLFPVQKKYIVSGHTEARYEMLWR